MRRGARGVRVVGRALGHTATTWFVPFLLIAAWQAASSAHCLSTRILPAPWDVALAFRASIADGTLLHHGWVSTRRAGYGMLIGGSAGFVLGVLNGAFSIAERLLDSTLQMLRNVPHLALIPLVILWFGIDESAKIFLVAIGVFFPIYINTFHGIRRSTRRLSKWGGSMG